MFTVDFFYRGLPISSRFPWKIGIVSFMAYPSMMRGEGDIVDYIKTIAEDPFFDGVEVCALTDYQWGLVEPLLKGRVVRCLQPDILMKRLNLNSLDNEVRREAVGYVKKEVEVAAGRGVRMVALCSGPDLGVERRDEAKSLLIESLSEVCRYAADRDVNILIESFDREHDKKLLIGPVDEAIDIIREVRRYGGRNMGLLWDLSHAPMLNEKPGDLRKAQEVLMHIHIGCAKEVEGRYLDTHPPFFIKGAVNKVEDVASLLKVLLELGYSKMVSFEVKPEAYQTSEEVINGVKGVLMTAYRKVVLEALQMT